MNQHITALLPVKNAAPYLVNNLKTILESISQTDELVIIDDGSNDGSSEILQDFERFDSRINLIKGSGTGLVNALNLGVAEASNEWIARYDADDTYEISRISIQRSSIRPNVSAIFSDYSINSSSGTRLGSIQSGVIPQVVSVSLISSQRTAHPSVMFNKWAVIDVGSYRESDFPAEDLSLWLRLAKFGDLISVPSSLLHYQLTPGSITSTKRKLSLQKKNELLNLFPISTKAISFTLENWKTIFSEYDHWENSDRRKILMFKDLLHVNNFIGLKKQELRILKEIRIAALKNPKSLISLIDLAKEKSMRSFVRKRIK